MGRVEVDVLLIGGGVASARCARALRRHGFEGSVLLVGEEAVPPYNRPPLSKEILRGAPEELLAAEPARWYERHSVAVVTGVAVVRLDPASGVATLSDARTVAFRHCLVATGAAPNPLRVPGGERALQLRTADDARRIRQAAEAAPGAEVVVVGGGLIGVEVGAALAALGLRPTIVELTAWLWGGSLGTLLDAWARERLAASGVQVATRAAVTGIGAGEAWLSDRSLPAAFVVAGIGVRPRAELAVAAGIGGVDGVPVGSDQRTTHPAIWAAGDVTTVDGRASEHWHAAREAGERAAASMLGLELPPPRAPWTFTEVAGVTVDVFGNADPDDTEEWISDGSVIVRARGGVATQLVVIGSAVAAQDARLMVEERTSVVELRARVREAAG
jgi:3-phenylpropionate/trans-cinnamate dioxygenase ferredoxin reductase subunit